MYIFLGIEACNSISMRILIKVCTFISVKIALYTLTSCLLMIHGHHRHVCVMYTCIYMYIVGVDCVIVKSGRRICGTGAALANAPLVQDKSYFEIKIQCGG